jgi:N-formylglutamate amidohydrolase
MSMSAAPFELIEPTSGETPVVVEVPHAGVRLDPISMALCVAPARAIARDADLYVDDLMRDAPSEGATLLVSDVSRYVLDLNRDEGDVDAMSVVGGSARNRPCGLLWRSSTRGESSLQGPVGVDELERRLTWLYRPYHEALRKVVARKRERFGVVIVLSAHSMPGPARDAPYGSGSRADVVTGTCGRASAHGELIAIVERHVTSFGWTLSQDDPYPGGATTQRHGRPQEGTHAIQIELARRLYMNEETLTKRRDGFALTQSFCRGLVAKLGTAALG